MNLEVRVDAYDIRERTVQVRRRRIDIEVIEVGVAAGIIETVGSVGEVGSTDGNTDVGGTGSLVGISGFQGTATYQDRDKMVMRVHTRSKR